MKPGGLQNVDSSFHIHALVKSRPFEAGPYSGARGEMNELVELHARKQFDERGAVEQIAFEELELLGKGLEVAQIAAFDGRIIEWVEIIECPNRIAREEQS